MVTGDRNIAYQQNLTGRKIALLVLNSTRRTVILPQIGLIVSAIEQIGQGTYSEVALRLPKHRRQR